MINFNQSTETWGAEFHKNEVRIVCLESRKNKHTIKHTFTGDYQKASNFAREHFLKFKGLASAVSHLPYKLNMMEGINTGSDEEYLEEETRLRPVGISEENLNRVVIPGREKPVLLQVRDDHTQNFIEKLPDELSTLNSTTVSPLIHHLQHADSIDKKNYSALILENDSTHLLMYQSGALCECIEIPYGLEMVNNSPESYLTEYNKAVTYYWESRMLNPVTDTVYIHKDGNSGEIESEFKKQNLKPGIPTLPGFCNNLEAKYYTAAMAAYQYYREGTKENETELSNYSFSGHNSEISSSRLKWEQKNRLLIKVLLAVSGFIIITLLLLLLGSLGLSVFTSKDKTLMEAQIQQLKEINQKKNEINKSMVKVSRVMKEGSHVSGTMQKIAGALPDKLWLNTWTVESKSSGNTSYFLSGYCFNEKQVTEFLGNLEKLKLFKSVKLKSTETIDGKITRRKTKLKVNNQDLIGFGVVLTE